MMDREKDGIGHLLNDWAFNLHRVPVRPAMASLAFQLHNRCLSQLMIVPAGG